MAATLKEIREGLAENLSVLGNAQPYMLDNPTLPSLQVLGPATIAYDQAMQRGLDHWTILVHGYQGSPLDIGAQVALDEWLAPSGATSVKAAIEADRQLGGLVQDLTVQTCSGYRQYDLLNLGRTLGAEWTVLVFNTGT